MTDEYKIVKKIHNDLIVKSIERETNYAIECDYDSVMLYVDDIKELLSLYYQEQKKNDDYKDKIKAKIEEVKDGTFDAKIVLQSLLEKE